MPDPTSAYVRPKGRPKVEKNPVNGFRKVSRVFAVDPLAAQEESVESKVFLPYGTSDPEYEDAKLVAQVLNPSEDVDKVTLSRIYMELPPNNDVKVEMEEPQTQILEGQRYVVVRKFIALIGFTGKNDRDTVKDLTLAEVLEFPIWKPPNPSDSLGQKVATFDVPLPEDEKVTVFLGSREIKNFNIHCEITETYHSSDNITSESQTLTKFGVATSVSVINPTFIPGSSFDIGLTKQKIYTAVQYKSFPTAFKLLTEKEAIRADGSRTLSRTYSAAKISDYTRMLIREEYEALLGRELEEGDLTPEILLPRDIQEHLPSFPIYETAPDWATNLGDGYGEPFFKQLFSQYKWLISGVTVDVSNPRMDVWGITLITAGIPYWVTKEDYFARPGIVNLKDTDIDYEAAPMKVPLKTTTYVWFEMPDGGNTSTAETTFVFPHVSISGAVTYSEGDTKNFDKNLNNYLRKGADVVTFESETEVGGGEEEQDDGYLGGGVYGPVKAKKFKGRAVTTSGVLTCTGTKYKDWDIKNKVLKFSVVPVFNKQSNTIWKLAKTVVNSSRKDLYSDVD
jgi:hypothetical protein